MFGNVRLAFGTILKNLRESSEGGGKSSGNHQKCRHQYVYIIREVVKTTTVEQDPPNHKIVGGVCLHPPFLTSKDDVFIA